MDWTIYWFQSIACFAFVSVAMFSGISGAALMLPWFVMRRRKGGENDLSKISIRNSAKRMNEVRPMNERNDAMINGALIGVGALGIFDNVVFHWLLQLHRVIPGPYALHVEVALVIISAGLIAVGIWRERRQRQYACEPL